VFFLTNVTISLPLELIKSAKEEAQTKGATFSGFIRLAIQNELERR